MPTPTVKSPTRPTTAEIDLTALEFNLSGIRQRVGKQVKILAVVKANAYGHGAVGVAKFLERKKVDGFGVAFPEEGVELRRAGIKSPIQVFTLPADTQATLFAQYDLEPTIASPDDVRVLERAAVKHRTTLRVHLKIDTGMNRIGVRKAALPALLADLAKARRIEVKGVFTHFASSDDRDKTFAKRQLTQFQECIEILRHNGLEPELSHCANSAAILDLPESWLSMVRPGISLYGYYSSHDVSRSISLKPVMTLRSKVALVKEIQMGESVSYGHRFVAQRRTRIVTVPAGYADGVPRLMTGKALALIHGKRYPVVGTICMDQCMVDVGRDDVARNDEVVLIGEQSRQRITAQEWADKIGTIPYEICCGISSRVPRIYRYT